MTVITFPTELYVRSFSLSIKHNEVTYRSPFGVQSIKTSAPQWKVGVELDRINENLAGQYKSLVMKLRGTQNQLELWNIPRPVPIGTMRGTMVLSGAHAAGDTTLVIDAGVGEAGETLKAGDMLGFGTTVETHLVMVVDDATANGSGVITVNIEPPLRNGFADATPVVWNYPKTLFRLEGNEVTWSSNSVFTEGFALDLIEDVRT